MTQHIRLSNVDGAEKIEVIKVVSVRGGGTKDDPVEQITEYFLLDGTRIARVGSYDNPQGLHRWVEKPTNKKEQTQ